MAEQNMQKIKTRIQHKHDLEVNWLRATFVPLAGELIIYDKETDQDPLPEGRNKPYTYPRFKIGDGIKSINDSELPFINHSEIHVGTEQPTDENIKIWFNPEGVSNGVGSVGTCAPEIYVGDGEMPENATIQIILDAADEEELLKHEMKVKQPDGSIVSIPLGVGGGISGEVNASDVNYATSGNFVFQEGFEGKLDEVIHDITNAIANNYDYAHGVSGALSSIYEEMNEALRGESGLEPRLAELETYVYDNDDSVLGLEVDFTNNQFTRLCGAKGLLPGEDFNKYGMYGQRRRCNVDDEGNILNFYGDDTPTYYRFKLYEGQLPTSGKQTTITTPLYYVLRQQGSTVMPIPGVGAFFVGFDGKEPTMVTLKPGEKTSVSDGVSATAGGSYDSTNNVSYYDGTFTLTTEGNFPSNVKVIVVFQSGYDENGFHGQVMVYQPKFYYKVVPVTMNETEPSIADVVRYYVSDKQRPEFKLHPAFYDKNGNEVDYILLSAYEAGLWSNNYGPIMDTIDWIGIDTNSILDTDYDTLLSIANIQPISGETRTLGKTNCELLAQNRGENWHIENIKTLSLNQLLMIIEYGQMNMQKAIGIGPTKLFGYDGRNGSLMTGSTASLGNKTGSASQSTRINPGTTSLETLSLPGEVSISYRGLENPWGNIYKFIDGIYYDNTKADGVPYGDASIYVCSKLNNSNYIDTGLTMPQRELFGYISRFKYSKEYDWLFIPAEDGGAHNLPVGDKIISGFVGKQTFLVGGTYYNDRGTATYPEGLNTCGPFNAWVTRDESGNMHSSDMGARLIYIPTADVEEV